MALVKNLENSVLMGETVTSQARRLLAEMGGIASTHYLASKLSRSPRAIRDLLKRPGGAVVYLGAGYMALQHAPFPTVQTYVEAWLQENGPAHVDDLVDVIEARYPHGHREAIRQWATQQPGRLQRRAGSDLIACAQHWKETHA
jgi:hypothetical protein